MYNTNFDEKPQFTFAKRTIRKLIVSFVFFIFVAASVSILFTGCSKDIEFISKGSEKRTWRKAYEPVFDTNYVASFVEGDPVNSFVWVYHNRFFVISWDSKKD
jgi:hypothetical protein